MKIYQQISLLISALCLVIAVTLAVWVGSVISDRNAAETERVAAILARSFAHLGARYVLEGDAVTAHDAIMELKATYPDIEHMYIVDFDGEIFAHSFKNGPPPDLELWSRSTGDDPAALQGQSVRGSLRHVNFPLIEGAGGVVHIAFDQSRSIAEAAKLRNKMQIFLALMAGVGVLGGIILSRRISQPLSTLAAAVTAYGDGKVTHREVHAAVRGGGPEARALRDAFVNAAEQRETAESESNRMGRLVEDSWNEIYLFDAEDFRFTQVNKGALENMGYSMEEMHTRTAYDIKPDFDRETFIEAVQPLIDGQQQFLTFQTVHERKDGTAYPVEVRLQLLKDEEPPIYFAVINDITERRRAEDEVRALNADLEARVKARTADLAATNDNLHAAMAELKQAQGQLVESEKMASLGGLVAGVAHEINTPVGIGVTAATHLKEAAVSMKTSFAEGSMKRRDLEGFLGTAEQSTEIIFANLQRASDLIKSFKQIAVDQSSDDRRVFRAREYIDEIVLSLAPRLKKTAHMIDIDCDPDLRLDSYPGVYSQIITNLILNSLMHAFDDGKAGTIRIALHAGDSQVTLRYSDDGKGMDEAHAAKVFEPFFTTKRGAGGSGLGMNILYNLVTGKLAGKVTCESTVGGGTAFTIIAPIFGVADGAQRVA